MLSLSLLIASLLSPTPLVPIIVFAIGLALLYKSTSFSFPAILVVAYANTFFLLLLSVCIIGLMLPGEQIYSAKISQFTLTITREGANLALLVFLRALAGFSVLLFFASSTPIPHLFLALRLLRVPVHVAELAVLVYRYSFMMLEQLIQMFIAADCRLGYKDMKTALFTTAKITASLFGRSMDFAERAQNALYCRNFNGSFPAFRQPAPLDYRWVASSFAIFISLVSVGNYFQTFLVL